MIRHSLHNEGVVIDILYNNEYSISNQTKEKTMRRLTLAVSSLVVAAPAWAQQEYRFCGGLEKDRDASRIERCINEMKDQIERLQREKSEHQTALTDAWDIFRDPVSIVNYLIMADVRAAVAHSEPVWRVGQEQLATTERRLDPSENRLARQVLRAFIANPVTFAQLEPQFRARVLKQVYEAGAQGAVLGILEHIKPVLEKPLDPVLAHKGNEWLLKTRCTSEEGKTEQACTSSPFLREFKQYYGIEPTFDTVYTVGFLWRRALDHRELSKLVQESVLKLMNDLQAPKN